MLSCANSIRKESDSLFSVMAGFPVKILLGFELFTRPTGKSFPVVMLQVFCCVLVLMRQVIRREEKHVVGHLLSRNW
jgi:hypothetical protein